MNDYAWWLNAIKGHQGEIHADHPQCGRYKMRRAKNSPYLPVAIWRGQDGEITAAVEREIVDPSTIWTWCAKNPVAEADYKYALANGRWPNDAPEPPSIGDNMPPQTITEQIPAEIETAESWLVSNTPITTKNGADIASNIVSKLRDLKKLAEAEHKIEKQPHLDAGREVDAKYKPLISDLDTCTKALLQAVSGWMAAERAKQEAERAAARAKSDPMSEEMPPLPEPVKVQAGGARGRKIGAREVKIAVINDYDTALAHFAHHPDVVTLIEKLAQHAVRDGHTVPGVEVKTEVRAA